MAQKVLLIDDDADDRALFCEAIEEIDPKINCNTATDGRKALSKLNNREIELPDIIFLDINMPGITGWECLVKLKEHEAYKNIPVIMYSTSSNDADINKANRLGALCFFSKPSNFKSLKASLEIVIQNFKNNSLSSIPLVSPEFVVAPK
jgi:CheY-like chemotaxis protein